MLEENCYVVSDDTREAVVIDCGALTDDDRRRITDYIEDRRLQVRHHLCTHMHYDHCRLHVGDLSCRSGVQPGGRTYI